LANEYVGDQPSLSSITNVAPGVSANQIAVSHQIKLFGDTEVLIRSSKSN